MQMQGDQKLRVTGADERRGPTTALFRMLASRLRLSAIGVVLVQPGGARLWAATDAFRACVPALSDTAIRQLRLSEQAGAAATRIDAAAFGPGCRFAAMAPIVRLGRRMGMLLVLDRERRRLGSRAAADLREAAELLTGLLPRPTADETVLPPTATLPRSEACRLIDRARAGTDRPLAVLLVDLDRFRAINEALGAAVGDTLLALTRDRLAGAMASGDRVVRLEGDRFMIVAPRSGADLDAFAQRVRRTVCEPLAVAGQRVVVQASIGIVCALPDGPAAPDVLMQADTALRRAKAEGRNRIVLHGPRLGATSSEAGRLELDLGKAVEGGQMRLAFQPYIDLETGAVAGCEALLRWRHPSRGDLLPSAFIPVAESSGRILPLGRWALRAALAAARDWPGRLQLSVNISPLQFHQPNFVGAVDAALSEIGFPAERLELEITETVLMRDRPETVATLTTLIDRGVKIALDDFGTGYSALAYLARLPHHRIKLDRTFVHDLANPATAHLIQAIIASARGRRIAVTAEGVEGPEQLRQVRRMGFTHAQGFALGVPAAWPAETACLETLA